MIHVRVQIHTLLLERSSKRALSSTYCSDQLLMQSHCSTSHPISSG